MKAKPYIDVDELLVKYLAGEASANECAGAEVWIKASVENRKYYEQFKLLWDESQKLARQSLIDEDKAWQRFRERVRKENSITGKRAFNAKWLSVAAAILLIPALVLLATYLIKRHSSNPIASAPVAKITPPVTLKSITATAVKIDSLPDGSVIIQNKNSTLKYPANFVGRTRVVELEGEAFFNVKHDNTRPFTIKANDITITVLGTSFNVKSSDDETEVIVETGVVSIRKQADTAILYAGEKLIVPKGDATLKKERNHDKSYRYYFDKKARRVISVKIKPRTDTSFNINNHPDLLKKLLSDPAKWAAILKNYGAQNNDISVRRAVIRNVLNEIEKEKLAVGGDIRSFRLNENEFIINDNRQPDDVHNRFKDMFIKESGYTVYFGGQPGNGKGIFLSPDSL